MTRRRTLWVGATFLSLLVALGAAQAQLDRIAAAQTTGTVEAPRFEVDPFWPKPMPNHWLLGNAIGVWVDSTDTVWIVHRGSATLANNEKALELKQGDCCAGAPPILAFDKQGSLVRHWGGPGAGYDWPSSNHGIFIDHTGMVWIGGNGPGDSQIMKFTKDGKFVAQYGKPNARVSGKNDKGENTYKPGSSDPSNFGRVAKIFVDPKANEAYIADGLNERIYIIDRMAMRILTSFGDGGRQPGQFFGVHSIAVDSQGNIYTTETWEGKRVQKFVNKGMAPVTTLHQGTVWPRGK